MMASIVCAACRSRTVIFNCFVFPFISLYVIATFSNNINAVPFEGKDVFSGGGGDSNDFDRAQQQFNSGENNNKISVVLDSKPPASDVQCMALASCGECTALNGCGWCPSSGICMAGDEIGPSNPSASCGVTPRHGQWTFGVNSCQVLDIDDCVTCIWFRTGARGWCQSTGKCYVGNDTGPTGGLHCDEWQTTGSNYFCRLPAALSGVAGGSDTETCQKCVTRHDRRIWAVAASDTGCYNYSSTLVRRFQFATTPTDCAILSAPTCAACTSATVGGGWCHDNQKCYQRNNYGPNTFYTCPSSAYTTQPSGCHIGTAKCQACYAASEGGAQRFGWCPSQNACLQVDLGDARFQPANGTCNATQMDGQWLNDASQCEILSAPSCSDCVRHAFAGWCPSLNKCFLKDDNMQPLGLTCPASQGEGVWSLDENDCRVLRASTCEACLTGGMRFAGWCAANNKCYRGTDHGPEGLLTCPERQWMWRVGQCSGQ